MISLRVAGPVDAEIVGSLHADSWRRHYRGAYSDSFLDGDVVTDRQTVWSARLADPSGAVTVIAEDASRPVGFVHVILDEDERWGSLLDNLHVAWDRQRDGIGRALMRRAAEAVVGSAVGPSMYLWVLEQNTRAQQFYRALGGTRVEQKTVPPPGGIASRLNGTPNCFRFAWPDAALLA